MYCVNVTVYANQVYVEFQKKNGEVLGEDFMCGELQLSCFEICQMKMCSLFGPSWCMNGSIDEVSGEWE